MLASQIYALRGDLRERGIVFAYSGYITEDILSGVGDALKRKLATEDANTKTIRSVFAVFVEQMQNIIRYSAERLPPESNADDIRDFSYGILTIGREGPDYVVQAGNLIEASEVSAMRQRLSDIQGMSRDELKSAYKQKLRSEIDEINRGAGVGLIEIARRATKPIEFDFMEIDDQHAFFGLKTSI